MLTLHFHFVHNPRYIFLLGLCAGVWVNSFPDMHFWRGPCHSGITGHYSDSTVKPQTTCHLKGQTTECTFLWHREHKKAIALYQHVPHDADADLDIGKQQGALLYSMSHYIKWCLRLTTRRYCCATYLRVGSCILYSTDTSVWLRRTSIRHRCMCYKIITLTSLSFLTQFTYFCKSCYTELNAH